MSKTVVLLIEATGLKGRKVIRHLATDSRFSEKFDLRVVLDDTGEATDTLDRWNVPWDVTNNRSNPKTALERVSPESGIDYLVACGWGYLLPDDVLSIPEQAALNCHSSYLPDYKGLSVYRPQWAHAERYGGATIHVMNEEIDEGPIITQGRFTITLWDTPLDIAHKYSDLTAPLLREAIALIEQGYEGTAHSGGRYFSKVPWTTTLTHGIVNHVCRAFGFSYRWEIEPTKEAKFGSVRGECE
ncbi:formyltransferase family protein [Natrialba swarupiae]|nr:formyltransferase family protein [Natrialba swarupiae]